MKTPKPGFNLAEVLMAMAFLGIIAAVTIPSVTSTTSNKQALFKAKNMAGELQKAMHKRYAENPDVMPVGTLEFGDRTKYTLKITTGPHSVINPVTGTPIVCSANNPCYRYADGGLLLTTDSSVQANYYDPDADGPVASVVLRTGYGTNGPGRVTTLDASQNCANGWDPSYVQPWTRCP